MRIIELEELVDDMVLAKPVFHKMGTVLLNEGFTNLLQFKEKFKQMGIDCLYIEDEWSKGIEVHDVVADETRREGRLIVADLMKRLVEKRPFSMGQVQKLVNSMVDDVMGNRETLINVIDLKNVDTYLYCHAVNVSVLSLVIGNALGYAPKQLGYLGMGALLHDIGLLMLPKEITEKLEADMTPAEWKVYSTHSQIGYDMLRNLRDIDAFSKNIVWGHHEQVDGGGYPRKLLGGSIHEMVQIVSVCDVYDELTSSQNGRKRLPSCRAIEYLISNIGKRFDKKIVAKFIQHIAFFPTGTMVRLSDQRRGLVECQNEGAPTRPVVRLVDAPDLAVVDLAKLPELKIIDSE